MKLDIAKVKTAVDSFTETKIVPLNAKAKGAIAFVILALPIALFVFMVYNPKQEEIAGLEKRRAGLEAELNEAKAAAAQLEQHKAELAATEKKYTEASVLLPQTKEIPALLASISNLGTQSGLDFLTFQPKGEAPQQFYAEIPVAIQVRGPYHNIGYFLYEVSKLDRIVAVNNINLGGASVQPGDIILTASFDLVTYKFLEAAAEPAQ